jgi:hypothetical protein
MRMAKSDDAAPKETLAVGEINSQLMLVLVLF